MIYPPLDHWIWLVPAVLIGACIGSFLNVVIYRVPLGMSVNQPKRSFCPLCKNQLTMLQNMPVISWLLLRGKCAYCSAPIPFRYIAVEIITAIFFGLLWWLFPAQVVVFLWIFIGILIAITYIDAEHMIIPTRLTWGGAAVGLIACSIWPQLSDMAGFNFGWVAGLIDGAIGWAVGFFGLWIVVELGKKAFGKKDLTFEEEAAWYLKEPEDNESALLFVIDDEEISWWDIFSRKTDILRIDATEVEVDGEAKGAGELKISEDGIELSDGQKIDLESLSSLSGRAKSVVIPREAMGMGDIHLLGMIGAFLGWSGVLFSLFSASFFALFVALIGRIGLGRQLPFGPYLACGAVAWLLGGWRLWQWYLGHVGL